ncbi:MAG: hypothetical protein AAFQ98_22195 [Bacteroidota bacterium]
MGVILWGAFIEKGSSSEEEILESLGYHTVEVHPEALGFESAVRHILRKPITATPKEIFTTTTSENYLILVDYPHSKISPSKDEEQTQALRLPQLKLYKFVYDNNINDIGFAFLAKGKLQRYLYRSGNWSAIEYGRQLELEPETKVTYPAKNLFGEWDDILVEPHAPFKVLEETISHMLELTTGKYYSAEYYHLQSIKLDCRIIR